MKIAPFPRAASCAFLTLLACTTITLPNARAAGANDRTYYPTIDPASAAPGEVKSYVVRVTNYSQGLCQTCVPLHFIQQIQITVPVGFTLVNPLGGTSPVSTEPNWHVASIAPAPGNKGTVITVVTNSTSDSTLVVGKSTNITITAKYTGTITGGCTATVAPEWTMYVNQSVTGGSGNTYALAPGAAYPKVTISSTDCLTPTNLTLALNTSEGANSQTIRTTDTAATVTLTATLTRDDTQAPIAGEPVTFSLGAPIPSCTNVLTNPSGVATCTFAPQNTPYPLGAALGQGTYDFFASFAGDTTPTPDLGGSTSSPEALTVNADGTGLKVSDATAVYGTTVDLKAQLTAQSGSGIAGKFVTFFLNGVQVGSPVLTDASGWAFQNGVSTAGISATIHDKYIYAKFAGDSVYGMVDGYGTLTITQQSAAISLSNLTQVYTGSSLSPTVTTNPSGLANTLNGAPQVSVGSYPVTATITDPNYTGQQASDMFFITKKTITATITALNKVYDASTSASINSCVLVGVAAVDVGSVGCTATGTFASPNVADGIVVTATGVTLTGTAAGNYQVLVMPTTTANITKAGSSVTVTGGSFVYDGNAHAATGSASTTVGSLTLPATVTISYSGSCTSAPVTVADGASCTATGTYAGDANHSGSSNTATITITKAGSSVTVTGGSFVYDGNPHAATASASTTAGTLTVPATVTISYSGSCTSAPTTVPEGTTCTATGNYAGDDNHNGSSNTATVTITKATQAIKYTAFTVAATAPGGTVTFGTTSAASVCTVTPAGVVTITGPGNCVIVSSQSGNENYQAAPQRTDPVLNQ